MWQSAHLRQPACHSKSGATRRMYWSWIWDPQPTHMDIRRFSARETQKQNLRAPWSKSVTGNTLWVRGPRRWGKVYFDEQGSRIGWTTYVEVPVRSFPRKLQNTLLVISTKMGLLTERHCQLTNRILQNSDLFRCIMRLAQPNRSVTRDLSCHCPAVYWPEALPPILQIGTQLWMPHLSLVAHLSPLVKLCAFF